MSFIEFIYFRYAKLQFYIIFTISNNKKKKYIQLWVSQMLMSRGCFVY